MKAGHKFWWSLCVVAINGLGWAQPTVAGVGRVEPNQIRVTAVVPDHRMIVLDNRGSIQQFFSNTDKPVAPTVTIGAVNGPVSTLTTSLRTQADQLLSQLKPNHVVSVRAKASPFGLKYPDFSKLDHATVFEVTPLHVKDDQAAEPYDITIKWPNNGGE